MRLVDYRIPAFQAQQWGLEKPEAQFGHGDREEQTHSVRPHCAKGDVNQTHCQDNERHVKEIHAVADLPDALYG
jgi:hypothetical protein